MKKEPIWLPMSPWGPYLLLCLGFLLSRWLARFSGVIFDMSPLAFFWQFLDPALLQNRPLESLYYLHTQPPAFNALLALILNSAGSPAAVFGIVYQALGLLLTVSLFTVLCRLGVRTAVAIPATLLFTCSPAALLYENWLFYTYPVSAVLCLAALAFGALARHPTTWTSFQCFFLLSLASLTRSLFHPFWLVSVAGLALWLCPGRRRRVLLGTLPAILLVGALCVKNGIEFGFWGTSSWLGMSLAKMTTQRLPDELREQLIEEGTLTPVARILPYSPLESYPAALRRTSGPDVPALQEPLKSTGAVNYNHGAYLAISQAHLEDSIRVLAHHPQTYLDSVFNALLLFSTPPADHWYLDKNRSALKSLPAAYDLLWGVLQPFSRTEDITRLADRRYLGGRGTWGFLILLAGALLASIGPCRKGTGVRFDPARKAIVLFIRLNILWVILVGNLLELGENNRFRMVIEPLAYALVFWLLWDAFQALANRLRNGSREQRRQGF